MNSTKKYSEHNSKNFKNTSKNFDENKLVPRLLLINDVNKSHNLQQNSTKSKKVSEILIDKDGKRVHAEYVLTTVEDSNINKNSNSGNIRPTLKSSTQCTRLMKNHIICHDAHYINNDDEDTI